MDNYELYIDVQQKKCYTCEKYKKCKVWQEGQPCKYKISKEAKTAIKGVKPFWGI